ncbi:MAG: ATP phosphoribosyltransferase regulatory subunit [Leptospiraceae bacterium]|nr:ATP phosphoribosyltransferase regulatory subunit [Leptospiraceae bacterium]MDW8306492.1 ATP phosphoribosyltransferase regulatory subunit [Leptospiraceae bacterium]
MDSNFRRRRPAYGFPFLDVQTTAILEEKSRLAQSILQRSGYRRIMPPALDFPETFSVYQGYESFRLRDGLGEDLALRSDVTVQVMKAMGNLFGKDQGIQKIYYALSVYRDIRKNYPSLREIWQIGAENLGEMPEKSMRELLPLATEILRQVFKASYTILLGDIRVLLSLEKFFGERSLRSVVYRRNAPQFKDILAQKMEEKKAQHLSLFLLYPPQSAQEFFSLWEEYRSSFPQELVFQIEGYWQKLHELCAEFPDENIKWEPLLSSPTLYYSGWFFEIYIPTLREPPVRGGEYKELLRKYSEKDLPACGFALDLSSLCGIR